MDTTQALRLFSKNWFIRGAEIPELTPSEKEFIAAAMGPEPKRWNGATDAVRMEDIVTQEPTVIDRIGKHLLSVVVGMKGCGAAVKILLERGAALEIDHTAYNVLHEAVYVAALDTLQAVFESGAADATSVSVSKPHVGWPDNTSLMYWAAVAGHHEVASLLIQYGVGVHHELPIKGNGERGTTSLQEASAPCNSGWEANAQGKIEIARLLIEDGAYYDIYSACALNDTQRLQEFIDDPDAVNASEDYGMTPLHWAARAGSQECATMLLERDCLVNAQNKSMRPPLQLAAEHDHADMIRLLAMHGANMNTQDKKGRTPLHRATYEGKVEAAEALLESGADPMVLNKSGKNAFEIARKDAKYFRERA